MKIFRLLIISAIIILSGCSDKKDEQVIADINEIVNRIHFENVIGSIQSTVKIQLATMQPAVGDKIFNALQTAADKAYRTDSLKVHFKDFLVSKSDSLDTQNFLKWLRSPLYSKINLAENHELGEDDIRQIMDLRNTYESDSVLNKRYLYIQSAIRHEETQLTADAYASTFRVLIEANRRFVDRTGKLTEKDVDFIVDSERKNFMKSMYDQVLLEKLYRYKNISDEELIQIADFKHSAMGKNATVMIHKAILYSVKKANLNFLYNVSRIDT